MLATLIVRVTLISRFVLYREIREINVARKLHVSQLFFWRKKKEKTVFLRSLSFVLSLQSAVCILHFVPSLQSAVCSLLQSAFLTDRAPVVVYLESVYLFYSQRTLSVYNLRTECDFSTQSKAENSSPRWTYSCVSALASRKRTSFPRTLPESMILPLGAAELNRTLILRLSYSATVK